jgi:SNF2 family DNA or RNA helicase
MEIIEDKYLVLKTRNLDKIKEALPETQVLNTVDDVHTVAVDWNLYEAQWLRRLKIKGVPSPIVRDYDWPGLYSPMAHQRTTAEFLTLNTRAFCFNEQGTGKTGAAIWASDYLMTQGYINRVLVVCPLSIMQAAWQRDLFQFAMHRKVGIAHGDKAKRTKVINGDYDYVVINYEGINLVLEELRAGKFDLVIIDEANAYKNSKTQRWKSMRSLVTDATWLWMMTGTPAAQSPVDAYGLAKLCVPENVSRFYGAFRESVLTQITRFKWVPKPDAAEKVHAALQPAIRFEKKDCLDLPELTYMEREAPLTPQQEKYYNILREDFLMEAGDEVVTSANMAVNISKLLQVSGGAVYTNSGATLEFDVSNRLNVVEEVVNESSNKVLVFVPFSHTIRLIKEHMTAAGIPCEVIDGDVSVAKRNDIFSRFQTQGADDIKLLIIQPKAAAHGVTLTAADTVIWYAPVTSAETYLQANARIDRQGQKNAMTVVHIHGSPIERKLYKALQTKLLDHSQLIDLYNEEVKK